jgi:hypothetical protein
MSLGSAKRLCKKTLTTDIRERRRLRRSDASRRPIFYSGDEYAVFGMKTSRADKSV